MLKYLILLILFSTPSYAEQIDITYGDASDMLGALTSMSKGYKAKPDDKEPSFFSFNTKTRITMSKDLIALQRPVDEYSNARNAIVIEISKGKGKIEDGTVEAIKFLEQEKELRKAKTKIELEPLKYDDLNLDKNPISAIILAQLHSLVKE